MFYFLMFLILSPIKMGKNSDYLNHDANLNQWGIQLISAIDNNNTLKIINLKNNDFSKLPH